MKRKYGVSRLPVLLLDRPNTLTVQQQQEVLLRLYQDTCASWRQLTEVRFKLLGLVPAVSVIVLSTLLKGDPLATSATTSAAPGVPAYVSILISLVGLVATLGLWVYDRRNDELYDDLISRARRIEAELGIATGPFLGRPEPSGRWVRHGTATTLVYSASLLGWLAALTWLALPFVSRG